MNAALRRAALGGMAALGLLAASCVPAPQQPTSTPPPPAGQKPPAPAPPPVTPPPPRPARIPIHSEPWIRIGLSWDEDSVVVSTIQPAHVNVGRSSLTMRTGKFVVRGDGGVLHVRSLDSAADSVSGGAGDSLVLGVSNPRDPAFQWRNKRWRGELRVFANDRGLTVVCNLPLETYLLGVVPGEIGGLADNLVQAGRAQAVAARSYTLFYLGRRAAEGFDLYGTVEDQVYGPVDSERPLATQCVTSTRGQVCLSEGWPIRANYCSTCGGITAEVWECWPVDPLPYLVSHRDRATTADYCAASPHFRWREEWKPDELAENLTKYAPRFSVPLPAQGVGSIVDVAVTSRSRSGRVWSLAVTTTTGRIEIPAYVLRQVLRRSGNPALILRSNLFKVDVRRDPETRRALAIVASGAGNGHGAGLCQTGALGMAKEGRDAPAILAHYYPGAKLEHLY